MTQEFKTTRAEQYANGKSSASVFSENHIRDYLAGYEQALEDSHAPEMLEMLKYIVSKKTLHHEDLTNINELITKATTT